MIECPFCGGTGHFEWTPKPCRICEGLGQIGNQSSKSNQTQLVCESSGKMNREVKA